MGLFAAITGVFKRSSDTTKEDQVNEFQDVSISGGTSLVSTSTTSTNTTIPVYTSSTSSSTDTCTTASANVDISMEEEACPCGGACTCQGDPEEESIGSSVVVQATFPGMDDSPIDTMSEIESPVKVRKIEDASTLPPISPEKLKQHKLPGFEDTLSAPRKTKKKANTKKSSAKLTRKSTAKRKK